MKLLFSDEQGELIVLKRRLGESKTNCFSLDGQPLPEIELPKSTRVRAEIYGWSEIEELSDSPRKQLGLLDRTILDIDSLRFEVEHKLEELRKNNEAIISLAREIQNLMLKTQGADELRKQLDKLNKPELNEAFESFDRNSAGQLSLNNINKKIDEIKSWLLEKNSNRDLKNFLNDALKAEQAQLESFVWYKTFSKTYGASASQIQSLYERLTTKVHGVKDSIQSHIDELETEHIRIEAQLNALAEQSGQSDFKSAMSKRKEYSQKLAEIAEVEKEIQDKKVAINSLLETRHKTILPSLEYARLVVYQARLAKIQAISNKLSQLNAGKGISITIDHLGDKQKFTKALGYQEKGKYSGLFQGIDKLYLSKNYPGYYTARFSPHEFIDVFLSDEIDNPLLVIRFVKHVKTNEIVRLVTGNIEKIEGKLVEKDITGHEISSWVEGEYEFIEMLDNEKIWKHLSPLYHQDTINEYYDPEKLKSLFDLDVIDVEDYPRILLDGRPIEDLSPGQRCSALIPIILVEGRNPLVIDQPEDNLDNKLVFDLVVDIMRRLKEQRQIIVATHNPNIPVSGDAEQVVVFESPSKHQCRAVEQGSIDDDEVIKHIKAIMEGGDKAFEMRMKKYNLLHSV